MRYLDDIWNVYISDQDGILLVRMVAPPCSTFELAPLNKLYWGKIVRSITLIPFKIFDDIWYTHISDHDGVSCQEWLLSLTGLLSYLP